MDVLTWSRLQFGDTAGFHILWPLMSIGLALYMVVMEAMWLRTKKETYYRQLKFWTKIFILTFAIGTATGFPLEFEFGTNWAAFSTSAGDFFGNILGFESTVAFALEAAFLGIFVFGWDKVNKWMHFFANVMIFVGATLSAFWIMAANSWMQVPIGVTIESGKLIVTDYLVAIFNPDTLVSFSHMWVACVETTLFMMMGICGFVLLAKAPAEERSEQPLRAAWPSLSSSERSSASAHATREFFLTTFKYCLALAIIVTPLQIALGDASGFTVAQFQPAKLAATELHWNTNPPGQGAEWALVAWPNSQNNGNAFQLAVPDVLSVLTTHSLTGTVPGLNDFAPNDRPSLIDDVLMFYSFRVMVAIGFALFFLMLLGAWYWWSGYLRSAAALPGITPSAGQGGDKLFWCLFVLATPLGFIATEAGWMVREIGRQPWVVYHLLRTSEGLSPGLSTGSVAITTGIFTAIYIVFGVLFVYFTYRIVRKGPDLSSPVPPV